MDIVCRTRNSQLMSTLCQNLKHNYECQMFCDVTLTTNQSAADNHQSVECHKLVLLSSSPYFKSLLSTNENQINIIDVYPVSINVVKEIIGFLYNGECLLHHSTLIETLETSVTWKLPMLTEECFTYMRKSKNMENVCRFYELSLKHQNIDALYDMSNYIREHLSELSEGNHLVQLSLKAFCEIIKSDEVNVETEDVICATAMSLIENEQSDKDITRCLKLIRFEHLTSDFLFDVSTSHPIMRNEPQKTSLKNALRYQCSKEKMQPEKTARFWGSQQRFVYVNDEKMICEICDGEIQPLIAAPDWIDEITSLYTRGSTILFVSAHSDKPEYTRNMMLVSLSEPCYVKTLPDLPERIHAAGVVNTGTHIFIMGGLRYVDGREHSSKTVDRLCLMSNEWETCPPLLEDVVQPVTLLHNQYRFVMGSYLQQENSTKVQRYSIETSEWTFIKDLPFGVDNLSEAAVIYKNRLTVVSSEHLMSYQQESDTWSVKEYEDLGDVPTALIVDGELCTCFIRSEEYSLIRYDEEDNVWNVKIDNIPDMLLARYGIMV